MFFFYLRMNSKWNQEPQRQKAKRQLVRNEKWLCLPFRQLKQLECLLTIPLSYYFLPCRQTLVYSSWRFLSILLLRIRATTIFVCLNVCFCFLPAGCNTVCTLRNRFSRNKWWEADGGAGVGLSWRTVAGYPVSCHEEDEEGKFPSGRHSKHQSAEPMQVILKIREPSCFFSVYVFNLSCFFKFQTQTRNNHAWCFEQKSGR